MKQYALRMVRVLGVLAALAALGGCQSAQQRAREQATQRWNQARAQVKAKLAADQFEGGNVAAAAGELAEAHRLDPQNPELVPLRARVWLAEGKIGEAARLLEQTRVEGAPQAEIEYLLGVVRQQQQRWDEALAAFLRAVESDPDKAAYVVAAAQAWLQLGEPGAALEFLLQRSEQFGWTRAYQAALAECHEQAGDWSAAAAAWRCVVDAEGAESGIRERLGEALYRSRKYGEAIPVLEALAQEGGEGGSTLPRLMLAECYLAEGRTAAARGQVQTVLQHEREHVPALRLLARTLALEGDCAAALRVAQRALALKPNDSRALELVAALAWRVGDEDLAVGVAARLGALDAESAVVQIIHQRMQSFTGGTTPD